MSEPAVASPNSQSARAASARGRRNRLSALEALERGFTLFRSTFAREAWRYYLGAAPLVLCFIPMWVVNGQIRISTGALLLEAIVLTGAYFLRVWIVGNYVQRVRERAFGAARQKLAGVHAQVSAMARLVAWKITLSALTLSALPTVAGASWFYGACQFATLEAKQDGAERNSIGGCVALSSQWFGGGVLFFMMLFPLWTVAWLNGMILAILLPNLMHSIFGVNTLLSTSMGMFALVRSFAFWLSLFAGAWLALDPIVKCTFIVVYQHLRSRREGDDLLGLLATLPRERQRKAQMIASSAAVGGAGIRASNVDRTAANKVLAGTLLVLATILFGFPPSATAATTPPALTQNSAQTPGHLVSEARIQKLRQALDEESRRSIYRWHDADHPSPPTWFDQLLSKIEHSVGHVWDSFWKFIGKLWPHWLEPSTGEAKHGWHLKDLRLWLAVIAAFTIGVGALLIWLRRRGQEAETVSVPLATAPLPDLSNAAANERSEDEWFALAEQLENTGDLRHALRAVYLGLLAGLAQRQWLTIRRDRTNREYLDEFTRRWRRRPQAATEARAEVPAKFRGSLRQFDRVWYGSHALTPVAVAAYRQDQRELLNRV
jgi:Domain of unknown function (DUF4129)